MADYLAILKLRSGECTHYALRAKHWGGSPFAPRRAPVIVIWGAAAGETECHNYYEATYGKP